MDGAWFQFLIIVVLMLFNGFFAASEIAVVSARRGRLQQRAANGSRGAQTALDLAEEPNRFLATVQVGITLIGTIAAAFGGSVLEQPIANVLRAWFGLSPTTAERLGFTLVVMMITYLSLILGELVPKRLALQRAEAVAASVAPIMRAISRLAAPVVWFLTLSTQAVLRLLGQSNRAEEQVTEEDVLSLVREGTEEGTLEVSERDLIERVFEFTDATARSIMTPRTEIVAVAVDTPLPEVVQRVVESGYSRIPVYENSLDSIVGVFHAKDGLRIAHRGSDQPVAHLRDLLRPPVFVLEHQRIGSVLRQLQQTRTHLALVLDEYGQVDGLLTLEDVLERLTGDIHDEYDEADPAIVQRADGSWLVDGLLGYADAEHRLGLPEREKLPDLPQFDTLAGLLLALFERIPTVGEQATLGEWQFEVVDMDGVRIDKILVHKRPPPDSQAQTEASLALSAVLPPPEPPANADAHTPTNGQV